MFKRQLLLFSFLLLMVSLRAGQLDSLRQAVGKMPLDTNKVKTYVKILSRLRHTDPKLAFAYSDTVMLLSDSIRWPKGRAYSFHYNGMLYTDQKAFSRALDNLLIADSIYQVLHEVRNSAAILNNIGNIYYHLKNFEKAGNYYEQAIEGYKQVNDVGGFSTSLNNIGSINSELKNYDKALYYYGQSLGLREREKDTAGICSTLGSIGLVHDKKGEVGKALEYYGKAINLCIMSRDNYHLCTIYSQVAQLYETQQQYDSTQRYMHMALGLAAESGDPDIMRDGYKTLSAIYEQKGNVVKAYDYYKKFIHIRDSVFSEENARKFVQTEMNFQFEKQEALKKAEQEKKDAVELRKRQVRTWVRYFIITGLVIVLLIGVVIVRGNIRKKKDNIALARQKIEIERQKKEIQDSIAYAKYIQEAILPGERALQEHWNDAGVLFKPRDVVSGDFYFSVQKGEETWLGVADCTGHGVPGALMSLVASNKMNGILTKSPGGPGEALCLLNDRMLQTLGQEKEGSASRDGMDIALLRFIRTERKLDFAGANRPLWLVRKGELIEFTPDKQAIGGFTPAGTTFKQHVIEIQPGDQVYVFTDGYADQFGGEKEKKFTTKRFRELVLSVSGKSIPEQCALMDEAHAQWRKRFSQTDDILVIGIRF